MLYRDYAHGVAMRVLGEIYHRLPTVQVALISAYVPTLDTGTGQPTENYLYSVLVTKPQWREINFKALANIEPPATPPCQNSCRLDRTKNPGVAMKDDCGSIRTSIQRQSGGPAVAARERGTGGGCARHGSRCEHLAALA